MSTKPGGTIFGHREREEVRHLDPLVEALDAKRRAQNMSHTKFAQWLGISRSLWFATLAGTVPVGRAVRLGATKFDDLADLTAQGEPDRAAAAV